MSKHEWNENDKSNRFCFVSHIPEQREELKQSVRGFPFWAYIDHLAEKKPDSDEETHEHTHFMIRIKGTNSIKSIARTLGIPSNFVQICWVDRSYGRYFLHLDNPDKTQYKMSDIHTNKPSRFVIWQTDNQDDDVRRLYNDICKLKKGELSKKDFIDLHYVEIQSMGFYQKFNFLTSLDNTNNNTI